MAVASRISVGCRTIQSRVFGSPVFLDDLFLGPRDPSTVCPIIRDPFPRKEEFLLRYNTGKNCTLIEQVHSLCVDLRPVTGTGWFFAKGPYLIPYSVKLSLKLCPPSAMAVRKTVVWLLNLSITNTIQMTKITVKKQGWQKLILTSCPLNGGE